VELITKLLKELHGQWLYQNMQVHDKDEGKLGTLRKEEIQMEKEEQQALGTTGLYWMKIATWGNAILKTLEIPLGYRKLIGCWQSKLHGRQVQLRWAFTLQ
jgi:hypothetical protein